MTFVKRVFDATYSPPGCENGVFLPKSCMNTRNTADAVVARVMRLDRPEFACSIKGVVAVPPQWTETHSLIRYPSPYGRSCALRYRPPIFLRPEAAAADRRRAAHRFAARSICFDPGAGMALNRAIINEKQTRGYLLCVSDPNSCWPSRPVPVFRPVATPLASRPLSVRGRGPARRSSSAATSPRARWSVRRATSPIARPIRTAASRYFRVLTGATVQTETTGAFGRAGGFLFVNSVRDAARPKTDRGDEICSRRS